RLGKIYNSAGNLEQAEHYLKQQLDAKPFSPLTHLELGKLYQKQKQWVQANKHLSVAAEVWKDADEGYKYAIETQQLLRDIASKL
ncbi:MAG: hypothetical protein L3J46_10825, partial [Kangiellaceae bacterium]|nr:hypothetical protein [Kangiellaceae bacterium]